MSRFSIILSAVLLIILTTSALEAKQIASTKLLDNLYLLTAEDLQRGPVKTLTSLKLARNTVSPNFLPSLISELEEEVFRVEIIDPKTYLTDDEFEVLFEELNDKLNFIGKEYIERQKPEEKDKKFIAIAVIDGSDQHNCTLQMTVSEASGHAIILDETKKYDCTTSGFLLVIDKLFASEKTVKKDKKTEKAKQPLTAAEKEEKKKKDFLIKHKGYYSTGFIASLVLDGAGLFTMLLISPMALIGGIDAMIYTVLAGNGMMSLGGVVGSASMTHQQNLYAQNGVKRDKLFMGIGWGLTAVSMGCFIGGTAAIASDSGSFILPYSLIVISVLAESANIYARFLWKEHLDYNDYAKNDNLEPVVNPSVYVDYDPYRRESVTFYGLAGAF